MDIGKGDWLICVAVGGPMPIGREPLRVGSLYQVAHAWDDPSFHGCDLDVNCNAPCLLLENLPRADDGAFCGCCFRPAGKGGMFNDLLTAKPVRVGEDA